MLNANAREANIPLIGTQTSGSSKKLSRFSLFRSLSDSRSKPGRRSRSAPGPNEESLTPQRVKQFRYPRTPPSPRSPYSVADSSEQHFEESRMLRLARPSQPPPSSYQILPEEGVKSHYVKARSIGGSMPSPDALPNATTPSFAGQWSTTSLPDTSPQPTSPLSPHDMSYGDPTSSDEAFHRNQRRKASMSKLMRHFGETKIPAEAFLGSRVASAQEAIPNPTIAFRKGRTKSLDMKAFSGLQRLEGGSTTKGMQPINRSRSLGRRSRFTTRAGPNTPLDGCPEVTETTQDRVRRARKMTQIFGPEISRELIEMAGGGPTSRNGPVDLTEPEVNPAVPPIHERISVDSEAPSSDIPTFSNPFLNHPSTPDASEASERTRRTQKLAKFFGVSQNDISCSVPPTLHLSPSSDISLESPPARSQPLQDVEVNIKVAGRRFWGLSPERGKYRNVQTSDAIVIDQLRTLKAS
ncbi:hypothetical protein D9611_003325 [Ephemerocybe angulata]|uniref:Uncharacterized protein n=1 Tax=Ephemerocybe angulata TaxID=980116 RepID=A0A8H5C8H7_9AGAR|nr:hypothetical protein D9611_003325 [Tulosesus angulatus]